MSHQDLLDLAAAYALGALDGEERTRFEAHLRTCHECDRAVRDYREGLAAVAGELPGAEAPRAVREALLERIDREEEAEPSAPRSPWWRLAGAGVAIVAALVVIFLGWRVTTLGRELKRREGELATLQAQVAKAQQVLEIMRSPDTQVALLSGLPPSPLANGRVWWNPGSGGVFRATGLPAPPAGKTYQLWLIAAGKPASAGVFEVDARGVATLDFTPVSGVWRVELAAVTLEPQGGRPQPTGAMYLSGKVL